MRNCPVLRQLNCLLIAATAFLGLSARAEAPVLGNPILTSTNQVGFTLTSDSRNYAIQSSTNLQDWTTIASTGFGIPGSNRVQSLSQFATSNQLFFRAVIVTSPPPFTFALTAKSNITFIGALTVDSFDSTDTNYSTLVTNTLFNTANYVYDINKRKDHGDVACLSTLTNSVNVDNANIYGKIHTPSESSDTAVTINTNGSVGDLAWHASNNIGFQENTWLKDADLFLPDVPPPAGAGLPPASGNVNGVNYIYVLNGNDTMYVMNSLNMSGHNKLIITGTNVIWWVKGSITMSGQASMTLAPGASVVMYIGNTSGSSTMANFGGGGININGNARNCRIYGLPTCTSIFLPGLPSNCAIYAPRATVSLSGSVSGAIIAKSITVSGQTSFHYDESLANLPSVF